MDINKRFKLLTIKLGEPLIMSLMALVIVASFLVFRLGTLLPGFGKSEVKQLIAIDGIKSLVNNPLNAPYKVWQLIVEIFQQQSMIFTRLFGAIVGLASVVLFYYVASSWSKSKQSAILGTIMFASSSWFLHYARVATPDILLCAILAALAYGNWIRNTQRSMLVILFGFFIAAGLVYVPGLVWFVAIGAIWQRKAVAAHIKQSKLTLLPVILISIALLAPLLYAVTKDSLVARQLIGLPSSLPSAYDVVRHILNVPIQIFIRRPFDPEIGLGRLPYVDVFTTVMCILGLYSYGLNRGLDRTKLIVGSLIIGTVLVGLRGLVSIVLLLPFVYLLVTEGLSYISRLWASVFPRNPLAKTVGAILIPLAVILSCYYNLKLYFVAWPNAPETKQAYSLRLHK